MVSIADATGISTSQYGVLVGYGFTITYVSCFVRILFFSTPVFACDGCCVSCACSNCFDHVGVVWRTCVYACFAMGPLARCRCFFECRPEKARRASRGLRSPLFCGLFQFPEVSSYYRLINNSTTADGCLLVIGCNGFNACVSSRPLESFCIRCALRPESRDLTLPPPRIFR